MGSNLTAAIVDAHDSLVPLIRTIPDAALGWRPSSDTWSLKQIISHLAHANDFYVMIVEEVRASHFGTVELHSNLAGWQQMAQTDAAVAVCITTAAALDCFERTYRRMLEVLETIQPEEANQAFVFWRLDEQPYSTTLRQRVIRMAAEHLREHQAHLSDTLTLWQTSQAKEEKMHSSDNQLRPVIARIWRGRTTTARADEYADYLYEHGIKPLAEKALGVQMLREDRANETEFVTISYWESVEAMARFAGNDPRRIHHLARDAEFLIELPSAVQILEIVASIGQIGAD